jgi:hypothetical protein
VSASAFVTGDGVNNGLYGVADTNLSLGNGHGVANQTRDWLLNIGDHSAESWPFKDTLV